MKKKIHKNEKPQLKKVGRYPVNSRITVDYSGEKPKIKFGYPEKGPEQIYHSDVVMIFAMLITLFFAMAFYSIFIGMKESPRDCIITDNRFTSNWTNETYYWGIFANCSFKDKNISVKINIEKDWTSLQGITTKVLPEEDITFKKIVSSPPFIIGLSFIIIYFLLIKGVALIFYKTKFGNRTFPVINKHVHNKNWYAKLTKTQLQYDSQNKYWYCEIPLFSNIFLDYEASGNMSDELVKVQIKEHPFSKIERIRWRDRKPKKGKGKLRFKKKKNISIWRARFIFKSKPVSGKIEVSWK